MAVEEQLNRSVSTAAHTQHLPDRKVDLVLGENLMANIEARHEERNADTMAGQMCSRVRWWDESKPAGQRQIQFN